MNYTDYTLGMLLNAKDETIKRNAISILKTLQRTCEDCGAKMEKQEGYGFYCPECWGDSSPADEGLDKE